MAVVVGLPVNVLLVRLKCDHITVSLPRADVPVICPNSPYALALPTIAQDNRQLNATIDIAHLEVPPRRSRVGGFRPAISVLPSKSTPRPDGHTVVCTCPTR